METNRKRPLLQKKRVLILGGEENPALPILKSLGRQGVHLTVASHLPYAPGFYSRYTSARLLSPNPWKEEETYVNWALKTCRRIKNDLVIPLGEKTSFWIAKYQTEFRKHSRIPFPDFDIYMIARDKALTMKAAQKLGVPIPQTYFPDEQALGEIVRIASYPVVIKPRIGYGARGISYPRNKQELRSIYATTVAEHGRCIIQEYIPQNGMQYKVESIQDASGLVKAIGVYEKLRYHPITGGSSSLNRTVHRPDICELARKLLEGIRWYGIGDCDFIEDPRDGVLRLMEINPRFTRSIRILTEAGLDFPDLLFRAALGEDLPPSNSYKIGLHMRYLMQESLWFMESPDRWKAKPSFFKLLGRDLIYEMLSPHDPFPGIVHLWGKMLELMSEKSRKKLLKKV